LWSRGRGASKGGGGGDGLTQVTEN
jgi:hypothetical protein